MTTVSEPSDNNDYAQLQIETKEVNDLIKKTRAEFHLLPIFKAKRPFSEVAIEDDAEESSSTKKSKLIEELETKVNNRLDLMTRLSSFTFLFHYLPRPLTALECAKHGWRDSKNVVDKDPNICVLTCDDCGGNMFVIDVDLKTCDAGKATTINKKYQAGLYDCHKEVCIWKRDKCDDYVYCFPLFSMVEGLERFQSEARHIVSACENSKQPLPNIKHGLDSRILSKVNYLANKNGANMETAYLLSLFGWKCLDKNIPGIQCDLCFTNKAFYQIQKDEAIDILNEHKSYCPWKNSDTANAYTPKSFSSIQKNQKICGSDWMKDVISTEYNILMRSDDLSLSSRRASDEKFYSLKQKLYQSYDLLSEWKSAIEKLENNKSQNR